jgi:hypothetical protein
MRALRLFLLFTTIVGAAACSAALPQPEVPHALALRETPGATVVVVKVKSPWYATRGIIVGKFRAAVPEYQAAAGLERKQFSIAQNGDYGGVYVWRDRATAERWFGPAWHERIKRKRGVDGDVRFIGVTRGLDGPVEPQVFEGPMVVAIATDTLDRYASAPGLRAAYEGEGLVISTWQRRSDAETFLEDKSPIEWFDTPIGIVNSN